MGIRIDEKLKETLNISEKSLKNDEIEEKEELLFIQKDIPDVFNEELISVEKAMEIIGAKNEKEELKEEIKKEKPNIVDENSIKSKDLKEIKKRVKKIELNQNTILEMLEYLPIASMEEIQMKPINKDALEFLNYNLYTFNNKLVIFSTSSKDERIKSLLELLNKISDYILSNSFYIFTTERTPIKKTLNIINKLGLNSKINASILETEKLLEKIDKIASCDIFTQTYNYSSFLLEKGLLLQSIILLNEAISIYIVEATKGFSKPINRYISLFGEENKYKLYSQVKTFFIHLFPNKDNERERKLPFFPNHSIVKEIDTEIATQFKKRENTWQNKGGKNFFKQYSYIINEVRDIRNNLAHGNMEIDFYDLKRDIRKLIRDFEYLSVEKNIFKLKGLKNLK